MILALSLIDLVYQRFQHAKDLKMSKKEVRDEQKNSEGDPQVKARIRQVQREMAMNRMMADVPDATVVVTNPTHYAVALQYSRRRGRAPRVVAKGMDHLALRIRDLARESEVAVIEDPPLARALHRACEIGEHVPEELFEAVARLLAYVYRMEGRATAARRALLLNHVARPDRTDGRRAPDRLKRVTDWLLGFGVLGLLLTLRRRCRRSPWTCSWPSTSPPRSCS